MALYLMILGLFAVAHAVLDSPEVLSVDRSADVIPGEYIVMAQTTQTAGADAVSSLRHTMEEMDIHPVRSTTMGSTEFILVTGSQNNVQNMQDLSGVIHVEPNRRMFAATTEQYSSTDVFVTEEESNVCLTQETPELWGLDRIDQRAKSGANKKYVHGTMSDGSEVITYVVDSGVNVDDDEFEGRAIWGHTASGLVMEGDKDLNGHGTHVAGTIGATTYGVAKNVLIVAVKVLNENGTGSSDGLIDSLGWLISDNKDRGKPRSLINLSLGFQGISGAVDAAVQMVVDAGITVVVAAGNSYTDACGTSPAHIDDVITVGASDINDNAALFSNWGTCLDVWAPGVAILSVFIPSGTTRELQGTSMASPHVAGVVARYLSSLATNPTPAEVAHWVISTATPDALTYITNDQATSPNRLLYMECVDQYTTLYPSKGPSTTPKTSHANKVYSNKTGVIFAVAVFGLWALSPF